MDRKWVRANRSSEEYINGVQEFCNHAIRHCYDPRFIPCPCWKCINGRTVDGRDKLFEHLMCNGIDKSYTILSYHGERRVGDGYCSSSNQRTDFGFEDT